MDIYGNGFLSEYQKLAANPIYQSLLLNQLYAPDTRRVGSETGTDFVRRQFATSIAINSVAAIAADAAGRIQGGRSLLELANLPTTFFRPFPQFAGINVIDSNDYSTYNALQVLVNRKATKGVTFQGSYTFSKSLDTRSFDPAFTVANTGSAQSASSTPFDIQRRYLNYARSDFDRTHVFVGYAVWDLPFGRTGRIGRDASPVFQRLIEGWNVNGVVTLETGRPFTIYSGASQVGNINQDPVDCQGCPRSMGEVNKTASNFGGVPGYFTAEELSNFSQPAPGQIGNTGRNYFTGPGLWNVDMAFLKRTSFTEKANLELRFELFNAFNHVNFGFPTAVLTSGTFGRIRDATSNESRKVRVGVKVNF